ncbi:uncharacterized protein Tco025E_09124 [Trypanosoma conorhini]|uniref:Uncharacterized protein n=1 Tax=Trypanosoma conorhini TaxID=83891 RepID=A0A3R7LLC4_9TRYP|nr:uncharacterized protein Tco025E_09124 [Trypanosoma conorhini]RNE99413.1 hypothetical protein Tco025E_09124 [Trypanosoma conorhini]
MRVGPLPRGIFSAAAFDGRPAVGDGALQATDAPVAEDDCVREGEKLWGAGNPLRRPVKVERECGAHGVEAVRYTNVSRPSLIFEWGHVCVGFLGPSECLSRLRRASRLPEKLQKPRAPDPHTHAGGGGPFAGAAEKRGRGSRGCGRQRDGVQGAACCGRARRRVPGGGA